MVCLASCRLLTGESRVMSVYWVCGYRNLWTRKARTLLTVVGIVLGVATVFAISITNASTAKSLEDFFAQSSGQADLSITSAAESSAGFRQRLLRRVLEFPGVETVAANTWDQSLLLGRDGDVGLQVMGIDPETDRQVRSYEVEQGRFLSASAALRPTAARRSRRLLRPWGVQLISRPLGYFGETQTWVKQRFCDRYI